KLLGVVVIGLALVACAPQFTLEDLEDQAMLSGDWSQVEQRERLMRRKAMRDSEDNLVCPDDLIAVCENRIGASRCSCVDRNVLQGIYANF
ncbi:MAG: hypothetical protein AAFN50_11040, partial [Pseudomonadota bacterium]